MRRSSSILAVILIAALAVTGCGKTEQPPAEPTPAAEAALQQQQQEAARRAEEVAALESKLAALEAAIEDTSSSLASAVNPAALEDSLGDLENRMTAARQLLSQLQDAAGDAWEGRSERLQEALLDLEERSEAVGNSVEQWRQREQEAHAARRDMRLPIDPATGLLEGLDGGQYEPYLVSVVERVQRQLRAEGLYAGAADGYFDVTTRAAVGRFQERQGLAVSGVPSPMTRARLFDDGG